MEFLRKLFFVGSGLAVLFLIAMVLLSSIGVPQSIDLSDVALGYDGASIIHLLWMARIVSSLQGAERRGASGWLYTAGFLHTLIALGVTVTFAAVTLRGSADSPELLYTALAPMGAAILPHFIGVAAGQWLEVQGANAGTRENSFLQQLAVDAGAAQASLKSLYSERERALQAEVDALKQQSSRWNALSTALSDVLQNVEDSAAESKEYFRLLSKETKSAMASVSQTSVTLVDRLNDTSAAAARMATAANGAAEGASQAAQGFNDAKKVVEDLNALHVSIVELLSNEIFKK